MEGGEDNAHAAIGDDPLGEGVDGSRAGYNAPEKDYSPYSPYSPFHAYYGTVLPETLTALLPVEREMIFFLFLFVFLFL